MNRWFVAALLTLALLIIVSPGIVGRLAEKSVEDNFNFAVSDDDEIVITTESFERGWFTSEGRHRIELGEGSVRALVGGSLIGRIPSLIVETRVDHGLLPIASMARDSGSLMPGLASTVSTLKLDDGGGEIVELPGKIYSRVGLTGDTTSRFLLESGSANADGVMLEWQGADVTVEFNPDSGSVIFDGEVLPVSMRNEDARFNFGRLTIDGQRSRSKFGFSVGPTHFEADSFSFKIGDNPETSMGRSTIDASSEIEGDRMNAASKLQMSGVPTQMLGDVDIAVDIVLNGLDAPSFHNIAAVFRNSQSSTGLQDTIDGMYPRIQGDLQNLLTSGLELRIDKLDVTLPNSELTTKFHFTLAASDPDAEFSWPALLLALNASADIQLPIQIYQIVEAMTPDIGMLVAMGILKKNGDYYEMRAEYAKGLVTVNGVPMPIPIPTM